ncbi:hypothetical protein MKW98_011819 [Papaver atlanticum]|uniref:Neprosin PEP catalytic domain-containing protein n=1 Tax=Papaver atlanticum TaxID=357466 RepID=A0AAD4XHT6_9MAGN|nr:hypothetical protein MKW98_011819 [Papaver atlanticum]
MSNFINPASWPLILAVFIFVILTPKEIVDGRTISNVLNKAIIKTIKVDKDEIIDCYDIYKQLSLNHPSFHNHTIQMRPSIYPKNIKLDNMGTLQLTQTWHKYGTCPHGTIPIRRNIGKYYHSTLSHKHHRSKPSYYKKPNTLQPNGIRDGHEYAVIKVRGNFLGAQAKINLWNPFVETPEGLSVSQIWVVAGDHDDLNSIEAGWEVHPPRYGDYQTRFFILWTTDTYKNYCINLECPGFVQTSSDVSLGCNFTEMSTFNGNQKDATFSIYKDQNSGNWWIQIQGIPVGYYPSSLFTQLAKTAVDVEFGGEIYDEKYKERHTTTQMGNGHFPSEGVFGISSFFNHVQVIDENNKAKDPEDVETYVSNRNCYDLKVDEKHTNGYGFYYGGPGYNNNCP